MYTTYQLDARIGKMVHAVRDENGVVVALALTDVDAGEIVAAWNLVETIARVWPLFLKDGVCAPTDMTSIMNLILGMVALDETRQPGGFKPKE